MFLNYQRINKNSNEKTFQSVAKFTVLVGKMDGNKTFTKLREGYSNLLIYTLKNNIKKTVQNVNVDASVIQHYGLTIEEDCFNRNPSDLAAYTKAITAARLSIESYTSKEQPYPTISNALQLNDMERLPNETSAVDHGR